VIDVNLKKENSGSLKERACCEQSKPELGKMKGWER
jgi:hypothetical protein